MESNVKQKFESYPHDVYIQLNYIRELIINIAQKVQLPSLVNLSPPNWSVLGSLDLGEMAELDRRDTELTNGHKWGKRSLWRWWDIY
jgi:hypothetical protein